MNDKPYWYPEPTDENWVKKMREDCPEETEDMSDDDIREYYAKGLKYYILWDHIGDAYDDYEGLADDFLKLEEMYNALLERHLKSIQNH